MWRSRYGARGRPRSRWTDFQLLLLRIDTAFQANPWMLGSPAKCHKVYMLIVPSTCLSVELSVVSVGMGYVWMNLIATDSTTVIPHKHRLNKVQASHKRQKILKLPLLFIRKYGSQVTIHVRVNRWVTTEILTIYWCK